MSECCLMMFYFLLFYHFNPYRVVIVTGTTKKALFHALLLDNARFPPKNTIPVVTVDRLAQVTPFKQEDNALTVLHLCGHKWCMNVNHYQVGYKLFNEQQVYCHHFLHNSTTAEEYEEARKLCDHRRKCWTNVYTGALNDGKGFYPNGII